MTQASHQQIIATCGDYGFIDPGLPVLLDVPGDRIMWGVRPGESVLWDPTTGLSVDVSAIGTVPELKLSIGVGSPGGIATKIYTLGKEEFDLCKDKLVVNYTTPVCGQGQQVDINLGCVKCDTDYELDIYLRNPWSKRLFGGDGEIPMHYNIATKCGGGCEEECDPKVECFSVACDLVNRINGFRGTKEIPGVKIPVDNSEAYFQPFWAVVIPAGKKVWHACISLKDEGGDCCDSCMTVAGLESMDFDVCIDGDGNTETLTVDLTMLQTPDGATTHEHMAMLQNFLNDYLHPKGVHAHINRGIGKCCDYLLTVAGCINAAPIVVGGGDPVFQGEDPFKSRKWKESCNTCGTTEGEETPGCKIRLFMDSINLPCNCGLPASGWGDLENFENRIVDVQFRGTGWHQPSVWWEEVVEQIEPEGFGYDYIYDALNFPSAGGGGNFNYHGGYFYGDFSNLTMPGYQFGSFMGGVKCNETYCQIGICWEKTGQAGNINALTYTNLEYTKLLIPTGDVNTQAAYEEVFAAFAGLNKCDISGEKCFPEPDPESTCENGEAACADLVASIIANDAANGGMANPQTRSLSSAPKAAAKGQVAPNAKEIKKVQDAADKLGERVKKHEERVSGLKKALKDEPDNKTIQNHLKDEESMVSRLSKMKEDKDKVVSALVGAGSPSGSKTKSKAKTKKKPAAKKSASKVKAATPAQKKAALTKRIASQKATLARIKKQLKGTKGDKRKAIQSNFDQEKIALGVLEGQLK
jgi:hypothetical protein